MNVPEVLRQMRAQLETGWTKGSLVEFVRLGSEEEGELLPMTCLQGACLTARYGVKDWEEVHEHETDLLIAENDPVADALAAVIREHYPERFPPNDGAWVPPSWSGVTFFNDHADTTFEDVMSVVDKAIVNEESRVHA